MPGGAVQGDLRLAGVEEDQDAAGDQHCLHPLRVAGTESGTRSFLEVLLIVS